MMYIQSVDQTAQRPKEAGDLLLNLSEASMPITSSGEEQRALAAPQPGMLLN